MEITFLGHACFKIISKDLTLITDPPSASTGIRIPKTSADIVTVSHHHFDHDAVELITGARVFDTPGEFEAKGAMIHGIPSFHDNEGGKLRGLNTIFNLIIEGIRLTHLGDLGSTLSDDQLSELGDVDILFVPTGGIYTIDAKAAAAVVSQIEPKIVIPMHFHEDGFSASDGTKLEKLDKFFKEMAADNVKKESKLKITKATLSTEDMEIIELTPTASS